MSGLTPHIVQQHTHDCAIACIAMAAGFSYRVALKAAGYTYAADVKGLMLKELIPILRKLGCTTTDLPQAGEGDSALARMAPIKIIQSDTHMHVWERDAFWKFHAHDPACDCEDMMSQTFGIHPPGLIFLPVVRSLARC